LAFLARSGWRRCHGRSCISYVMRLRNLNAPGFVGRASVHAAMRRAIAKFPSPRFPRNVSLRRGTMRCAIMGVRAPVDETSWCALSRRPGCQPRYPCWPRLDGVS
jgi:hypothetical protein